jgi:hypothetical protein
LGSRPAGTRTRAPAPKASALPVPTRFELTFGCGHVGTVDLSALPPDRRAGRIAFLKDQGLCGVEASREKRRKEDAEASAWSQREGYARLSGGAEQAAFANRVRYDLMRRLYEWAVQEGHDAAGYERVEATAKAIDPPGGGLTSVAWSASSAT